MKRYLTRIRWIIFFQILFSVLAAISMAIGPYYQRIIIDDIGSVDGSLIKIIKCIVIFILCETLTVIFTYLAEVLDINGKAKIRGFLHEDFLKGIFNLSYDEFKKKDIGEYISVNSNNIDTIINEYYEPIIKLITAILRVMVFGVVVFTTIKYQVGLCILLLSLLIVFVPNIFKNKTSELQQMSMKGTEIYTERLRDFLEGKKVVNKKTYKSIVNEHNKSVDKMISKKKKSGIFGIFALSVEEISVKIIDLIMFILLGILLLKGQLTSGMAVASFLYSSYFIDPIQDIMMQTHFINTNKKIKDELVNYIDLYKDNCFEPKEVIDEFQSEISLKNVCLQYDNFQIKDFNYTFKKGKKYAIIGHSGSGKSTIINLLMKYVVDYSGEITVDGKNIRNVNLDKIVGNVNQIEYIYKSDFINNVTVFNSYSEDNLEGIIPLFQGCNAIIDNIIKSKNCNDLSGGEKQFISFIRALVANSEILIMDEPFSAVDRDNLRKVMSMFPLLKEKTVIMVTHDLSDNLRNFDEIILMDNGRIKVSGNYDKVKKVLTQYGCQGSHDTTNR